MQQKWYHASPKRLPINTVLTGTFVRNNTQEARGKVFITTEEIPHYTIIDRAVKENWHVYEVLPLQKKIFWGDSWDEAACHSAQIVRYIGGARGIVRSRIKKIPWKTRQRLVKGFPNPHEALRGQVASRVIWHQVARWNRIHKS